MPVTRRSFLSIAPFAAAPGLWPSGDDAATAPTPIHAAWPSQRPELAMEMVAVSHNNVARVKELLAIHPTLSRAAWDWGFGDWEDALGAASHVGNREIAQILLAHGARPTIFSAAMLGQLEVVKALIAAAPGIESTPGPHGITLLSHAAAGGPASQPVLEYLKTLPGANARPDTQPITPDQVRALAGAYRFGDGPADLLTVAAASNGGLTLARPGFQARNLFHVGDLAFYPAGAPRVRIRFTAGASGTILTVHDPVLVLEATRAR